MKFVAPLWVKAGGRALRNGGNKDNTTGDGINTFRVAWVYLGTKVRWRYLCDPLAKSVGYWLLQTTPLSWGGLH